MDRAIPEVNRLVRTRQIQEQKRSHYQRLNQTKCSIDNRPPVAMTYPIVKLKKEQQIEGKSSYHSNKNVPYRPLHRNRA
jgi:hypothetical protein